MEILHLKDLGDTSVISECSLGVNLVIDFFLLCSFRYFNSVWNLKAIGPLVMEILHFEDLRVSFGCERSCSSHRRVSNFNRKVPQGGIYPHIKFERDPLNTIRVRAFTSSGSTGGRDAKTIISPNTLFGDIINITLGYKHQHRIIYWTANDNTDQKLHKYINYSNGIGLNLAILYLITFS